MNNIIKTPEDLYAHLDRAIEDFTAETINKKVFDSIIEALNKNEFGIKIDSNLVVDNRESFNELGYISYYDDETSY
jgi:hypothetical protein